MDDTAVVVEIVAGIDDPVAVGGRTGCGTGRVRRGSM